MLGQRLLCCVLPGSGWKTTHTSRGLFGIGLHVCNTTREMTTRTRPWISWYAVIATNTRRWVNVGLMLAHRLRRWPNIKPTLAQRLVRGFRTKFSLNCLIIMIVFYLSPTSNHLHPLQVGNCDNNSRLNCLNMRIVNTRLKRDLVTCAFPHKTFIKQLPLSFNEIGGDLEETWGMFV